MSKLTDLAEHGTSMDLQCGSNKVTETSYDFVRKYLAAEYHAIVELSCTQTMGSLSKDVNTKCEF